MWYETEPAPCGLSVVTETSVQPEFAPNQATYQRLKLALGLNLRRQIFIAVCDDLPLRDRLAIRLQMDLSSPHTSQSAQLWGEGLVPRDERLITLKLHADDPNPLARVSQWLDQAVPLQNPSGHLPAFQILGIEQLTRQPAAVQRAFWTHLQEIERGLPTLDCSLLLWMPQPWFRALPQSAPEFWRCRTAVFEFVGDPKPLPGSGMPLTKLPAAATAPPVTVTPQSARSALAESAARMPALQPVARPVVAAAPAPAARMSAASITATPTKTAALSTLPAAAPAGRAAAVATSSPPAVPATAPQTPAVSAVPATRQPRRGDRRSTPAQKPPSSLTRLPREWVQWEGDELPELSLEALQQAAGKSSPPRSARRPPALLQRLPQPNAAATNPTAAPPLEKPPGTSPPPAPPVAAPPPPTPTTVQQLQQHIAALRQRGASAEAIAEAFCLLGEAYRDRIEAGDNAPETLRAAVETYEHLLRWLPQDSSLWSNILNDLGNLYWMLSRSPLAGENGLSCLSQSIQSYQMALTRLTPEDEAQGYPMIQNNLGVAYADLARHCNLEENLQRSIQSYQEALRFRTPETDPLQYATTQNNLGTSYWTLAQHRQPQLHLKQAIAAYTEALRYYDADSDPLSYGMIQNNLGTAYWNLAQHETPQDGLQRAIAAYETALQYRTREAAPLAFAATQNNLGTAYWHLASQSIDQPGQQSHCLQQAVRAYEVALQVEAQMQQSNPTLSGTALSFDGVTTRYHLGLAHFQLGTQTAFGLNRSEQRQHLEAALGCHLLALQGSQSKPELYQTILNSVLQTMRAFHQQWGMEGQNWALSQIPGTLLSTLLPRL